MSIGSAAAGNQRTVHQIGLPYHWGVGAEAHIVGDAVNDLLGITLDPNVLIQDSKTGACDIIPGRRPRGPELEELVNDYRRRAGLIDAEGRMTDKAHQDDRPGDPWDTPPEAQQGVDTHEDGGGADVANRFHEPEKEEGSS